MRIIDVPYQYEVEIDLQELNTDTLCEKSTFEDIEFYKGYLTVNGNGKSLEILDMVRIISEAKLYYLAIKKEGYSVVCIKRNICKTFLRGD